MKQLNYRFGFKMFLTMCVVLFCQVIAWAQDAKVEINGNDVGNWFSRNWVWVTAAIILLLILLLFSGSRTRRTRTTSVYRKGDGTVTKTTTNESVDED